MTLPHHDPTRPWPPPPVGPDEDPEDRDGDPPYDDPPDEASRALLRHVARLMLLIADGSLPDPDEVATSATTCACEQYFSALFASRLGSGKRG